MYITIRKLVHRWRKKFFGFPRKKSVPGRAKSPAGDELSYDYFHPDLGRLHLEAVEAVPASKFAVVDRR